MESLYMQEYRLKEADTRCKELEKQLEAEQSTNSTLRNRITEDSALLKKLTCAVEDANAERESVMETADKLEASQLIFCYFRTPVFPEKIECDVFPRP